MTNTNTNTIPMPAISFHLGSNNPGPFQIDAETYARGPRWFYDDRVQKAVDQGITKIMLHRPFGEPIKDDLEMDIDGYWALLNSGDVRARDYAQMMMRETVRFFAANPKLEPTIYIGSMMQPAVMAMTNDPMAWAKRVMTGITPFIELGFDFVFDHSAAFEPGGREETAFSIISAMLPGRVQMEAAPHHEQMWGTPTFMLERYYKRNIQLALGRVGPLTRAMADPLTLHTHYSPSRGGLAMFILECHLNGHECMIASHVESQAGLSIREARDRAQMILDSQRKKREQ